jgi:hypothetical protein
MSPRYRKPRIHRDSAPSERDEPRICATAGKRMYASEAEAKATAAHQMSKESAPAQLRIYRCLYCGSWHLTSKET